MWVSSVHKFTVDVSLKCTNIYICLLTVLSVHKPIFVDFMYNIYYCCTVQFLYGWSDELIALFANYGSILYIVAFIPVVYLLEKSLR